MSSLRLRLIAAVIVAATVVLIHLPPVVALLGVGLTAIMLIASAQKLSFERRLESHRLPSREAWAPLAALAVLLGAGYLTLGDVRDAVAHNGAILAFILSFALVSEGIARSGLVTYLAYRITERCGGNSTRLILYLFILSSLLAYYTSNDIVILTLTPIVISIAHQARFSNAKLLLLSQFVAANTLSMGLLFGSPSNLIIGQTLDISFLEYAAIMAIPTAATFLLTFAVITGINRLTARHELRWPIVGRLTRSWSYSPSYSVPRFAEYNEVTTEMRRWVGIFGGSVALLAVTSTLGISLFAASIPIATVALITLVEEARRKEGVGTAGSVADARTRRSVLVRDALTAVPLGIVLFGVTFFAIAGVIARQPVVRHDVVPNVQQAANARSPLTPPALILGSGALVNAMNDLPSAAIEGRVLRQVHFESDFSRIKTVQSSVVGLNLGTIVTPIGALAGLIWFDVMRRERRRLGTVAAGESASTGPRSNPPIVPEPRDLLVYGGCIFVLVGSIIGVFIYGSTELLRYMMGPVEGPRAGMSASATLGILTFLFLFIAIPMLFLRSLRRNGVALTHLADVFTLVVRLRLAIRRHRLGFSLSVIGVLFSAIGGLLYLAEKWYAQLTGTQSPFRGGSIFIPWLIVFIGSGFPRDLFPRSRVGVLLAGTMALGSVGAVVFLIRALTRQPDRDSLKMRLARGDIPTNRLVILNVDDDLCPAVQVAARTSGRLSVAVGDASAVARLDSALGPETNRDHLATISREPFETGLAAELHLARANELILVSRSLDEDYLVLGVLQDVDREIHEAPAGTQVDATEDEAYPDVIAVMSDATCFELGRDRLSTELLRHTRVFDTASLCAEYLVAKLSDDPADQLGDFYRVDFDDRPASPSSQSFVRFIGEPRSRFVAVDVKDEPAGVVDGVTTLIQEGSSRLGLSMTVATRRAWSVALGMLASDPGEFIHGARPFALLLQRGRHLEWELLCRFRSGQDTARVIGAVLDAPPAAGVGSELRGRSSTRGTRSVAFVNRPRWFDALRTEWETGPGRRINLVEKQEANDRTRSATDRAQKGVTTLVAESAVVDWIVGQAAELDRVILTEQRAARSQFNCEEVLLRLEERRREAPGGQLTIPKVMVCCEGASRVRGFERFPIHEVVDTSWFRSSFLTTFLTCLLSRAQIHGELAQAHPDYDSIVTAFDVASATCRFLALSGAAAEFRCHDGVRRGVVGHTFDEVVEMSQLAFDSPGQVVALLRFGCERSTLGTLHGTLEVIRGEPSLAAKNIIQDGDLLLIAPHV